MMRELKPDLFCVFYEMLEEKFIKELYPEGIEYKGTPLIWSEKFKRDSPYHGQNIAHVIFDINKSGDYFFDKYSEAKKMPDNFKVNELRLYKGLRFYNEPKPWTPKLHESYDELSELDKINKTTIWLEEFGRKHATEINARFANNTEQLFLEVITSNLKVFESKLIKNLVQKFLNHIKEKDYYKAWEMLSPKLKEESVWAGSFKLFKSTFQAVKSNTLIHVNRFAYNYRAAMCHVHYWEKGTIYNLSSFLTSLSRRDYNDTVIDNINEQWMKCNRGRFYCKEIDNAKFKPVSDMDDSELENISFQKALFVSEKILSKLKLNPLHRLKQYEYIHKAGFFFTYSPDLKQWFIDAISTNFYPRSHNIYRMIDNSDEDIEGQQAIIEIITGDSFRLGEI